MNKELTRGAGDGTAGSAPADTTAGSAASGAMIRAVSESLIRLRLLGMVHFMKPMRERERERCEIPPGCLHVLGWLKSRGVPVSMTDLASASVVSKPNLTIMVDRLCADGLAERLADSNDRRIVNVALTQKGVDFLHSHKLEMAAFIEGRLSLLNDSELEKLKRALDDLSETLTIMGERQGNQ